MATIDGYDYHLYKSVLPWEEARRKCEEFGGQLAIGSNPEVHRFISDLGEIDSIYYIYIFITVLATICYGLIT